MVGCPGTAEAVVIYAKPGAAADWEEKPWRGGAMDNWPLHPLHHSPGDVWWATLLDGQWHSNRFEAALKFNDGTSLAYYPGGVHAVYSTPLQVLHVFKCAAWITGAGGLRCRIMEVPPGGNYPRGPCPVGSEHECFIKQD